MSASGLHGIKRIRKSEQEKKEKEKREVAIIEGYDNLVASMNHYRCEHFDSELALNTTESVLKVNPDYYTAWNYRREVIIKMFTSYPDTKLSLLQKEIHFTDSLLKISPKSYWLWNHRRWALNSSSEPNWHRELKLVEMMLDLDPRNFHGWDYRRYVVRMSKISSSTQEFEYTTKMIMKNFSNFSAWHYRSKLLPIVFPSQEAYMMQVEKDIEIVRNAVFTDPDDQSAWIYQRFLLLGDPAPSVSLKSATLFIHADSYIELILVFNQRVKLVRRELLFSTGASIEYPRFYDISTVQRLKLKVDPLLATPVFQFQAGEGAYQGSKFESLSPALFFEEPLGNLLTASSYITFPVFYLATPPHYLPYINAELKHIRQLYDLEPDRVILTLVAYHDKLNLNIAESLTMLKKLEEIDPLRKNYYQNYRSTLFVKERVRNVALDGSETFTNLKGSKITILPSPIDYRFLKVVDLSGNSLSDLVFVGDLILVQHLNVDSNYISSLRGIERSKYLKDLSLRNNLVNDREECIYCKNVSSLKNISLEGNPLEENEIIMVNKWLKK